MKRIYRASAALSFALILSLPALAGDLDFPKQSPPPPSPQTVTTPICNEQTGCADYSILDAAADVFARIVSVLACL